MFKIIFLLIISINSFAQYSPLGLLSVHNDWRFSVNAGMVPNQPIPNPQIPLLEWDEQIASEAQSYSDKCVWGHSTSSERNGTGENIALGFSSDVSSVNAWANEYVDFVYPSTSNGVTGHYTQVVWANTTKLGCGYTYCPQMQGVSFGGTYLVCRYSPAGNYYKQAPYSIESSIIPGKEYSSIFTVDNVKFNNHYYSITLSDLVITSMDATNYNSSQPINYVYLNIDKYHLYIPSVFVDEQEWSAILEYIDETTPMKLNKIQSK